MQQLLTLALRVLHEPKASRSSSLQAAEINLIPHGASPIVVFATGSEKTALLSTSAAALGMQDYVNECAACLPYVSREPIAMARLGALVREASQWWSCLHISRPQVQQYLAPGSFCCWLLSLSLPVGSLPACASLVIPVLLSFFSCHSKLLCDCRASAHGSKPSCGLLAHKRTRINRQYLMGQAVSNRLRRGCLDMDG